nr:FadR/GntR family transcriptional regulator [Solimonas marina]
MSNAVFEDLGQAIINGDYPTGSSLPGELDLASAYGVSRTVVREALYQLTASGLVLSRPKVGAQVLPRESWEYGSAAVIRWVANSPARAEFLHHVTEMRRVVEPEAAALAALRADDGQRARVAEAMADMRLAVEREDVDLFKAADENFHLSIAHACGNPLLMEFAAKLRRAVTLSRETSTQAIDDPKIVEQMKKANVYELAQLAIDAHAKVADAILLGNDKGARKAMTALLKEVDHALTLVLGV